AHTALSLHDALPILALLGPALYVAITTFHQEMLPTQLLLTVAATREGIPFPSVVEALMMELMFEALREAGVHCRLADHQGADDADRKSTRLNSSHVK